MDYKKLGSMLKEARSNAKYTQPDVASKLGVTFQNVSSWERGKSKIDIDTLVKLCDLYEINFVNVLERANDTSSLSKPDENSNYTPHEKSVLLAYNKQPKSVQEAVDRMLGVENEPVMPHPAPDDMKAAQNLMEIADIESREFAKSKPKV